MAMIDTTLLGCREGDSTRPEALIATSYEPLYLDPSVIYISIRNHIEGDTGLADKPSSD